MKHIQRGLIGLGVLICIGLIFSPLYLHSQIQQQVGVNARNSPTGGWRPILNYNAATADNEEITNGGGVPIVLLGVRGEGTENVRLARGAFASSIDYDQLPAFVAYKDGGAVASRLTSYVLAGSAPGNHLNVTLGLCASAPCTLMASPVAVIAGGSLAGGGASHALGAAPILAQTTTTSSAQRAVSVMALTQTTANGISISADYTTWSVTSTPATNVQATASRAAGAAGVRHVPTHITACSQEAALAAGVVVNLRDGATGAGTVLWTGLVQNLANDSRCISEIIRLPLGTAATAMTLEFSAAGGAGNQQTVTLAGYSVN